MNRRIVVYARARSPGARFSRVRFPAIKEAMNDDEASAPLSCLSPSGGSVAVAARPLQPRLSCPLGRATRLIPISPRNGLFECRPVETGHCPNFMSFGGGFFCRAHLGLAGEPGARLP
ncbi:MAG: hypothetical protein RLZZ447_1863 [Verrucomicrobiota bacterium]